MINKNITDIKSEQAEFDNIINVTSAEGQPQHPTYLRRAKGLVKNGRAEWINEKTIRLFHATAQSDEQDAVAQKYQYCCQNTAQNYLAHIIPVPDDFNLNSACLNGVSKPDFISGLKKLTNIVKSMYSDMIQGPAEYGLPLVDDIQYEKSNPKALSSKNSVHRLITVLYCLVHCGKLAEHGILFVDKAKFQEMCKLQSPSYKVANSPKIFQKLRDFNFAVSDFDGKGFNKNTATFKISYPDENVIFALYGYMQNAQLKDCAILPLNYFLCISEKDLPNNHRSNFFADYFSGDERELYIRLNEFMTSRGFHSRYDSAAKYTLGYFKRPKDKQYFMRCYSENGKLLVCFKLDYVNSYTSFIEKMPETVKQMFRRESDCPAKFHSICKDTEHCGYRRQWTLEGKSYKICNYGGSFQIAYNNPEDIEYYKKIIILEQNAAKANKK